MSDRIFLGSRVAQLGKVLLPLKGVYRTFDFIFYREIGRTTWIMAFFKYIFMVPLLVYSPEDTYFTEK